MTSVTPSEVTSRWRGIMTRTFVELLSGKHKRYSLVELLRKCLTVGQHTHTHCEWISLFASLDGVVRWYCYINGGMLEYISWASYAIWNLIGIFRIAIFLFPLSLRGFRLHIVCDQSCKTTHTHPVLNTVIGYTTSILLKNTLHDNTEYCRARSSL